MNETMIIRKSNSAQILDALKNPEDILASAAQMIHDGFQDYAKSVWNIGHALHVARERFPNDKEYGKWCNEQNFPVKQSQLWLFRGVYERYFSDYIASKDVIGQANDQANYLTQIPTTVLTEVIRAGADHEASKDALARPAFEGARYPFALRMTALNTSPF